MPEVTAILGEVDDAPGAPPTAVADSVVMTSAPETSLARLIARKLMPWAGLLIVGSALALALLTIRTVNGSIEPEIANRTTLMGTVINRNIQRAVSAGVPLGKLVGAEQYFGNFLKEFPRSPTSASRPGVSSSRPASGRRISTVRAVPARTWWPIPIKSDGEQIGYIIIDVDTGYIASEFENVLLDLGVVALVAILLAFEVLVVMTSVSLTAPFNRLQHLVTLQAAGDFSRRIESRGRHAVDLIGAFLSERAEALHRGIRARRRRRSIANTGGSAVALRALRAATEADGLLVPERHPPAALSGRRRLPAAAGILPPVHEGPHTTR